MKKLQDYIKSTIDNRGKNPNQYFDYEKYPVIDNVLIKNTLYPDMSAVTRYIDQDTFDNFLRGYVHKNMPLITLVGNGIGNVTLAPSDEVAIVQNTIGFEVMDELDEVFLYYYLRNNQEKIRGFNRGSGQPSIKKTDILSMEVDFPTIDIQKKIVNILMQIDEKIEINNAINRNLQEQCDAIYRDCFVTNIDKKWKQGSLSELITVKYGKDHKKLEDGNIPCYGSGGVMRYVDKALYDQESVLIPRKGSLNNVLYVNEPFWSVDTMFFTMMKTPNVAKFVYHFVKEKDLVAMNTGSAVPSMTSDILNAMELLIPSQKSLEEFEAKVSPLYEAMKKNEVENKKLSELRDSLLPRLMSRELDVSDIDI